MKQLFPSLRLDCFTEDESIKKTEDNKGQLFLCCKKPKHKWKTHDRNFGCNKCNISYSSYVLYTLITETSIVWFQFHQWNSFQIFNDFETKLKYRKYIIILNQQIANLVKAHKETHEHYLNNLTSLFYREDADFKED